MLHVIREYRKRADGDWLPVRELAKGFPLTIAVNAAPVLEKRREQGFSYNPTPLKGNQTEALIGYDTKGNLSKIVVQPFVEEKKIEILDGIFTVQDEEGHRTYRIETKHAGPLEGKRVVSFLSGPNNTADYTSFAFIDGNKFIVWKRFRGEGSARTVKLAELLIFSSKEDWVSAGELFARESGRCWKCHRPITHPESIQRGLGPVCYEQVF